MQRSADYAALDDQAAPPAKRQRTSTATAQDSNDGQYHTELPI